MTREIRTFIQPADIAGVEIECPKCQLAIFYPVSATEEITTILAGCPHCHHQFFDDIDNRVGKQQFPAINDLQKIAASLKNLLRSDRTDIHAHIRFRVNGGKES